MIPTTHKYRAKPTEVDGIRFASKKEAERYKELKLLEKAGEISGLMLQPSHDLTVNDYHIAYYVADFRYTDRNTNSIVIEDCKGYRTAVYKLKKKLMQAIYGITITET